MKNFLNNTNLKIIAIISMFIDHIAQVFYWSSYRLDVEFTYEIDFKVWYIIMRMLGRIAFPIFAFLIAQGFFHTSSVKKYFVRLLTFALISEVVFDLAFRNEIIEFSYQNVFFTLTLGLLAIWLFDHFKRKHNLILSYSALAFVSSVALVLMSDYNFIGVLMIFFFYFFKENKKVSIIGFSIMNGIMVLVEIGWVLIGDYLFPIQIAGFLALPFILNYNHHKGRNLKYLFYLFYPGHLLLLYIIKTLYLT